ncbi:helix-turn-helix domain-containing protein [Longispora sp. K20-0274]|uniref:MmyB family transcriptional regulator n=1 Tax=Longispora sp. K20-0274 TaxID=3088255 RepID=UPI003999BD44
MTKQTALQGPLGDPATELARLVRQCRYRMPSDNGVMSQETAAHLVGCSLQWYRRLESGRAADYSEEMLEGVARGLQMTDSERYLLFWLGRGRSAPGRHPVTEALGESLLAMVEVMPWPAWITDPAGVIQMRNRYLADWLPETAGSDNFVAWVIRDQSARETLLDWKTTWLPAAVAYVKMTIAIIPKDERVQALVRELAKCAPARELWENAAVERIEPGADIAMRPLRLLRNGSPVQVNWTALNAPGASEARLVQLIPPMAKKRKQKLGV